jgi:beta-aspartyl-peptidase (threonine type)
MHSGDEEFVAKTVPDCSLQIKRHISVPPPCYDYKFSSGGAVSEPVILVHGGAWTMPDEAVEANLAGVRSAVRAGWDVLCRKGSAIEACEAAVRSLEDDEAFDAGRGSCLTSNGRVQMDAMIMDGRTLRAGGVGCVEQIRNPICAARKVLEESPHVYLVADGAEAFAREHNVPLCANEEMIVPREVERLAKAQAQIQLKQPSEFGLSQSHDTVGAVALDRTGNIAAATSTGGTLNKTPGRVGDSSLIGCGCYADNESAAVSLTGWGEAIMKLVLGKWAADHVASGPTPQQAAEEALRYLNARLNAHGGIIIVDAKGRIGLAHNTPRMAWALRTSTEEKAGYEIK